MRRTVDFHVPYEQKDEPDLPSSKLNQGIHYFPGGWSFFSSFGSGSGGLYYGAFFTEDFGGQNIYHNAHDDDLPITAVLIPF